MYVVPKFLNYHYSCEIPVSDGKQKKCTTPSKSRCKILGDRVTNQCRVVRPGNRRYSIYYLCVTSFDHAWIPLQFRP
jgi:hypothetical protein